MLQHVGQARVVVAEVVVFDHRNGGQQLQGGFPEVIGRLVTLQRSLGVLRAAAQLGQRQGEPLQQLLVECVALAHGCTTSSGTALVRVTMSSRRDKRAPLWVPGFPSTPSRGSPGPEGS